LCFVINSTEGKLVDFKKHAQPLINAIASYGVTPTLGVRNDIIIDGLKVSGNAEHVWKSRVLHHGTLLFNSNLTHLDDAIRATPERFEDKSVKSKRSQVGNIRDFINIDISIEKIKKRVIEIVSEFYLLEKRELQTIDLAEIQKLVESKYTTWQWNFGYSPKYRFKNLILIGDVEYSVDILVDKGGIVEAKFYKNGTLNELIGHQLIGCIHQIDSITECLNNSISKITIHRLFFNKNKI
jgi:lipoate-protein ligase A